MDLQGQPGRAAESGYAMAALLVALAVMSVLMSAMLPAWRHQAQREKEAELIFRGEQYVRAIQLWERRMGPGSRPPSIDILVQQKFLRRKYKDPMTADGEFQLIYAGLNPAPAGRGRGRGRGPQPPTAPAAQVPPGPAPAPGAAGPTFGAGAGIHGVQSKSTEASIRVYKGGTRYNEWRFLHAGAASTPGGIGGSPIPGGRGRRGGPGSLQPPGGRGPGRGFPGDAGGRNPFGRGTGGPGRGRGQ